MQCFVVKKQTISQKEAVESCLFQIDTNLNQVDSWINNGGHINSRNQQIEIFSRQFNLKNGPVVIIDKQVDERARFGLLEELCHNYVKASIVDTNCFPNTLLNAFSGKFVPRM